LISRSCCSSGVASGAFGDAQHGAGRVADDAAVEARVGWLGAEDRRRSRLAPVRRDEVEQELGGEKRRVAGEHENVAHVRLERGARGAHGVAGAERRVLHDDGHTARRELLATGGRRHDDERLGAGRAAGLDHPIDHAATENGVEVLRHRRAACGCRALRP